jgi:hypothetical protein
MLLSLQFRFQSLQFKLQSLQLNFSKHKKIVPKAGKNYSHTGKQKNSLDSNATEAVVIFGLNSYSMN